MLAMLLLLSAALPSPEAEALGRRLANAGTLATMIPLLTAKEVEELVLAHCELSKAEQGRLRQIGTSTAASIRDRLTTASGHGYAQRLALSDLRALVAFEESPVAARYRSVVPQVIGGSMAALGKVDFKGETLVAFCKETGKACRR